MSWNASSSYWHLPLNRSLSLLRGDLNLIPEDILKYEINLIYLFFLTVWKQVTAWFKKKESIQTEIKPFEITVCIHFRWNNLVVQLTDAYDKVELLWSCYALELEIRAFMQNNSVFPVHHDTWLHKA